MKNLLSLSLSLILSCFFGFSQVETAKEVVDKPTEVTKSASIDVPFAVIEKVPIYQGCDKTKSNTDLKNCMSEKIQRHVAKKFNTEITDSLNITGRQRIITMFKISKEGEITGVRARASHPLLEKEAIRVVSLIPQMESPGFQKGEPVIVSYSLPIVFTIVSETKPLSKKEKRRLRKEGISKKIKQKN